MTTVVRGRDRAEQMAAEYRAGATLEEVGRSQHLTRERVRQVLKKHGFDMEELKGASKAARRDRSGAALEATIRSLLSAGVSPSTVARRARVPLDVVAALGGVDPDVIAIERLERRPGTQVYADDEILECLRIANASVGGVMTTDEYASFAVDKRFSDGRPWPGRQTPMGRFGSWRNALAAAGLLANPSSGIAGKRQFDRAHCIDAILEVERHFGRVPTAHEYDVYAREHGSLPSLATVRNRHGRWQDAVASAIGFRRSAG